MNYGGTSGAILDADIEMNATRWRPSASTAGPNTSDDPARWWSTSWGTCSASPSADRGALMYSRVGVGERRRVPNADDVAGLCAVRRGARRCDPSCGAGARRRLTLTCAGGGGAAMLGWRGARRAVTRRPAGGGRLVALGWPHAEQRARRRKSEAKEL